MVILLFLLWLLLSERITAGVCLSGAVAVALVYLFCAKALGYSPRLELRMIRKLGRGLEFLLYLIKEMLLAGFVVMRLIYTKGRDMEPVLVRFRSGLKSEAGNAALADAITLTAGTITVETAEGGFYVHALDRSLAEGIEHSPFAARLKRLED